MGLTNDLSKGKYMKIKATLLTSILVTWSLTAIAGEVYSNIGNSTYSSDGRSWQHIGNTTYGSDGSIYNKIGNTTYSNSGNSYNQIGNTTYGSNGSSATSIGNSTYINRPDQSQRICQQIGSQVYCN